MPIETTMYVHACIMKTLNRGADATGRGLTSIIKLLMQRVMEDNQKLLKAYSRVKYQERDVKENWNRIHISLNEYEYEYYLDMRKFYKMSVSLILAYAVSRYFEEIIDKLMSRNNNTDNYFFRNYTYVKEIVDGIICWQIYWGIPQRFMIF